jgi:HlyD family secretion protein
MQQEHSITAPESEQSISSTTEELSDSAMSLPPSLEPCELSDGRPKKRRWGRFLLAVLGLVVIGVVLRATILAPKPVVVDVATTAYGVVEQTITNTRAGTVKAWIRARLSPETSGRVIALPHRENSMVKQGDLLLRLDDSLQKARLEVAVEDVRVAEARAEEACLAADLAVKELSRFTRLSEAGVASEQILDSATSDRDRSRAACRAATAALGQAKAQLRFAHAELDLTELRAPFDGVVADLRTELGEWLTPSPPGISLPPVIELLDP